MLMCVNLQLQISSIYELAVAFIELCAAPFPAREAGLRVCGSTHCANIRPGGSYYRGSWQCQHGCRLPERLKTAK